MLISPYNEIVEFVGTFAIAMALVTILFSVSDYLRAKSKDKKEQSEDESKNKESDNE